MVQEELKNIFAANNKQKESITK